MSDGLILVMLYYIYNRHQFTAADCLNDLGILVCKYRLHCDERSKLRKDGKQISDVSLDLECCS